MLKCPHCKKQLDYVIDHCSATQLLYLNENEDEENDDYQDIEVDGHNYFMCPECDKKIDDDLIIK